MTAPAPYVHLAGTAQEALTSWGATSGCTVRLRTSALHTSALHWLIGHEDADG